MEDCEIEDREKLVKKAFKKLNEIEKLKKKSELTTEEIEKISKELYYRNIVDPVSIVPEYSEKQKQQIEKKKLKKAIEAEKKAKELEKKAKRDTEKKEKELEKKARREAEKKEREAEKEAKRQAEKKEREARIEAEKEARRQAEKEAVEIIIKLLSQNELKNEWVKTLSENNNNINKAFRLMSLKYHPDKNTNKIWAEEKQKELNTLKELAIKRKNKYIIS